MKLILAHRFAQHTKDHCALVEHNRLVRRGLIIQRGRCSHDRGSLFKGQRAFLLFALRGVKLRASKHRFAEGEGTPLSQALRNPRIVERLQPDSLAPPLICDLAREAVFRSRPGRIEEFRSQK